MSIEELKEKITIIREPRRVAYGNIRHKLEDIIIIGLCSVICGGEDYADMEEFGVEREGWLREFLEHTHGIPDSETFRRVLERLEPQELSKCLTSWIEAEREDRAVIAIDGKTICGSGNKKHRPFHVISAFVAENQITLGELTAEEKSNEITAVPELLDLIDVENAIITADAMSCQKKIAEKIAEKKADYVIGLKGNQPTLLEDVQLYFKAFNQEIPSYTTLDKGHGRLEKREYRLLTDVTWLGQDQEWKNLRSVGMVHTIVEENGTVRENTRYFITSLTDLREFSKVVRKHWSIENQLHWCLDVLFREDASKIRKDNAPLNMNVLRKCALSLLNQAKYARLSKKKMMFKASLNPQVLFDILFPPKK